MNCPHCDFVNDDDDHRCGHCGRLMPAIAVAAPASYAVPKLTVVPHIPRRFVAPPMRRVTAAVIDVAMVLLGFGTFMLTARLAGSEFGNGGTIWITFAASLIFIALFYGLIWTIAVRETAGMSWVQLQLLTFDGPRVSGRDRAIRFVSTCLGYASCGLGLLWALADDKTLAFHDLASKTYPAETSDSR
jgi:uncharacterized RDD family membrane protein YckC